MSDLIAIYPATFDPITNGHTDLVERASRLFSKVVVAIARSQDKEPFFKLDERIDLAREALKHKKRVVAERDRAEAMRAELAELRDYISRL